ncbi:putative phosphoribosyltransferase [Deinococcus metalli]|uniref:Phosphoribosyltransferase n=1 Tax=Deinococcus metalli TaxID=1141878 RepID=A0A7W8NPB2_9DEIO|nr:phosphoribosyltransferase family protein [Deinococcus metalli]MBB5376611.1 putative phosphoribosyltransferase [Deinococcus metalli]GHF42789.1 phosphoribosyltransferase [Deinococcus metalli]
MTEGFRDRSDAGEQLAAHLRGRHGWPDTVVLGLPRGGVPVAAAVAHAIGVPLDVCVVRKLGSPGNEELAVGAVAPGGVRWLNHDLIRRLGVTAAALADTEARERQELRRRERVYRAGRPPLTLTGRTALLVDDGLATGATMRAAVLAARALGAARTVVAVPVAAPDVCGDLRALADEVVCVLTSPALRAVGQFYASFPQTTDAEVMDALREVAHA